MNLQAKSKSSMNIPSKSLSSLQVGLAAFSILFVPTVQETAKAQTSSIKVVTLGQSNQPLTSGATNAVCASGGTKVVFSTASSNVVSGDTNSAEDVFLRDTDTGAISLVS